MLLKVRMVLFALVIAISGCSTVKLIGDYDAEIDKGVTQLQKDLESFFVKLDTADGDSVASHAATKAFYGDAKVSISALRVRADATERNSHTVRMLDSVQVTLDHFERDHKQGIKKFELPFYRGGFISQFTAILTFELAKKRGETPDIAKAKVAATPPDASPALNANKK